MAVTTTNTTQTSTPETSIKKYNYDSYDINADDLVKDLNANLSGYVKYKRWDTATADQFKEALDTYIEAINNGSLSSDYLGRIIDSSGTLTDTPLKYYSADNTEGLSAEDYSQLSRKDKRGYSAGFLANQQVAAYIDKVAKARYQYEKKINDEADAKRKKEEEERNKPIMFDVNTYGLRQFATTGGTYGNDDTCVYPLYGTDPEAWMKTNEKGVKRAQALGEFIKNGYIPYIQNTNFDFSNTVWKTKDNYISALSNAIEELNNETFNEERPLDYQELGKLMEDPTWYRYLLNDEKSEIPEQPNSDGVDGEEGGGDGENNVTVTDTDIEYSDNSYKKITADGNLYWDNDPNYTSDHPDTDDYSKKLVKKLVKEGANQLTDTQKENLVILCKKAKEKNKCKSFKNYNEKYICPYLSYADDNNKYYYVCYDENANKVFVVKSDKDIIPSQKNGGTLVNKYKSGDTFEIDISDFTPVNEGESIYANGTSNVLDRKSIFRRNKNKPETINYYTPTDDEAGLLTTAEIVRLTSIIPDIAAAVNPDGFTSFCLGLGSTAMNFASDLMENPSDWGNNLKNLGINLGLTTIGAIPLLGGAGNSVKIVRVLKNMVPKIMNILSYGLYGSIALNEVGAFRAEEGTDESKQSILRSLSKIGKSGPENEMTIGDWKNVLLGIRTVLSFRKGFKNRMSYKKIEKTLDEATSEVMKSNPGAQYGVIAKVENNSGDSKIVTIALRNSKGEATDFGKQVASKIKTKKKYSLKTDEGCLTKSVLSGNKDVVEEALNNFLTTTRSYKKFSVASKFGEINWWNNLKPTRFTRNDRYGMDVYTKIEKFPLFSKRNPGFWNSTINFSEIPLKSEMRNAAEINKLLKYEKNRGSRFYSKNRRRSNLWERLKYGVESYPGSEIVTEKRIGGRLNRVHRILYAQAGIKIYGKEGSSFDGVLKYNSLYGDEYKNLTYKGIYNGSENDYRNDRSKVGSLQSKRDKYGENETLENIAQGENSMISKWQEDDNNRVNDFLAYYNKKKEEKGDLTIREALDLYNTDIKKLYELKREIAGIQRQEKTTYISNNKVAEFNRLYNEVYPTMGKEDYVGFYDDSTKDENSEVKYGSIISTFGTSTAERGIDITKDDISDFGEERETELKKLLGTEYENYHLVKDKSGLWHIEENEENPAEPKESEGPKTTTNLPTETGSPAQQNNNRAFNFSLVDPLNIARYLNMSNANRLQLRNNMLVQPLLHVPTETQRWVYGNQAEVQAGHQMAGMLNHHASQVSTSDPNIQAENFMKEFNQGLGYIQQGNQKNDEQIEKTREAQFAQSKENQQNRADVAKENREEIHKIDLEKIASKNRYYAEQAKNLNALLSEFLDSATDKEAERKELLEIYESVSLSNEITNNPDKYGLDFSDDELQIYRDVMSGRKKLSALTKEEKETYNVISRAIQQKKTEIFLSRRGISYTPVNTDYNTGNYTVTTTESTQTGGGNSVTSKASGGILRLREQAKKRRIYNS